jgi:ABC-type transporter Mla maintaining outer membrane lipid asymmetry ATPase subunit MlaF
MTETRHSPLEQTVRLIMAASVETPNFSLLEVENLSNRFGDSASLTSISFSVREKAIVGVIGPSGCFS